MQPDAICDELLKLADNQQRFLVGIAGPPGSGKSTLAEQLRQCFLDRGETVAVIPMDGFHLDNAILEKRDQLANKGSPSTFDADGFVNLIFRLSSAKRDVVIPVFDRFRDLAVAGAAIVNGSDRFLIVEGNYLLLSEEPWGRLSRVWGATVLLNPGFEVLEMRLTKRWLDHGLTPDQARIRALDNDIPNAKLVLTQSKPADIVIT